MPCARAQVVPMTTDREKGDTRLDRQFRWIERKLPASKKILAAVRSRRATFIRVPVALALIVGGTLSILPFLGIWMLPVGLLLLAIDVKPLRPFIANGLVRGRRLVSVWSRKFRDRGKKSA